MKENQESLIFRKRVSDIKEELRRLREKKIIDQETYRDFFFLISNATTFDQLDQMADDLAGLCEDKREALK